MRIQAEETKRDKLLVEDETRACMSKGVRPAAPRSTPIVLIQTVVVTVIPTQEPTQGSTNTDVPTLIPQIIVVTAMGAAASSTYPTAVVAQTTGAIIATV